MKILVVGASGFIGSQVCRHLLSLGYDVIALTRNPDLLSSLSSCYNSLHLLIQSSHSSFEYLQEIDVVIYAAGIAHVQGWPTIQSISSILDINLSSPLMFATNCLKYKVKKFIFISSVKVHGETSTLNNPFHQQSSFNPVNLYSLSKKLCEENLTTLFTGQSSSLAIIRLPLVYGPNPKGNIKMFIKLSSMGIPLPIGSLDKNHRSYLSIYNLCDFLVAIVKYSYHFNESFLVADKKPLSTREFVTKIALSCGCKPKLLWLPVFTMYIFALIFNQRSLYEKLCLSFVVDSTYAEDFFHWTPPLTFDDSLQYVYAEDKQ